MNINYKVKTDKNFETAVQDLKESLSKYDFGVLWELNFKDKFKEKGLHFDKNFKVLEVCNPKQAKEVLDSHIEAGYFLPCKMVVYEENNSTFIGMINPTKLIDMINDNDLLQIAQKVEEDLKSSVDDAK